MGTLYVVSAPTGDADDLTLRAIRILDKVGLIVTDDVHHASSLLAQHSIVTPLKNLSEVIQFADVRRLRSALETGDMAILCTGWSPGPTGPCYQAIRAAVECGICVVPVPGPALPITSLVASGLPADSFVYLGQLAVRSSIRRQELASLASERRTLVALIASGRLLDVLRELNDILGDRPLAVGSSCHQEGKVWRGTVGEAAEQLWEWPTGGPYVLIVGGARGTTSRWDEDLLRGEIRIRLDQGFTVKEISRQLAVDSGWPRREIYALAMEVNAVLRGI